LSASNERETSSRHFVSITVDDSNRQAFNISMKPGVTSQSELALDELDDYLSSDASPEGCMQLSDLDGFLTGVAVSPELIQPGEWYPVIWSGDDPVFEDEDLADLVFSTIIDRYNEIVQSLAADPPQLDPIFWQTGEGVVIAGDWAEGFVDAMSLRSEEWGQLLDDEEAGLPLIPIISFVAEEETEASIIRSTDGDLHAESADLIPSCVIEIDAYWKGRRGAGPKTSGTLH
jgi:uncharacterized protein